MRKYWAILILLFFSCSSIRATENGFVCSPNGITQDIGGHEIQLCDYPGLIQKHLFGHTWVGEYGPTAITLFARSEKRNFVWVLTTLNKGQRSNLTKKPETRSVLMHIECDCVNYQLRTESITEYSDYFGHGRKLHEIKKHFDLPWENSKPEFLTVPCALLEN